MKRIIALCLTIVMLLGMVSMVASANEVEYFTGVSLALRESIAISFKADEAAIQENFTKVEFVKNGNVVQTIEDLPEANDEGKVAFTCTKIAPSEMGTDITAKLYLSDAEADAVTASVYDYCDAVLADEAAAAELKTLVVDMLNYGAATQTYINDTNALVNAELTPEQQALGTAADAELPLENIMALGADPEGASVTWTSAALSLRESVAISYKFTAASVEGLSVALACGDNSWTVNSFTDEGNGVYSFRFTGLNPAMMRDAVTAVVMNGETAVSPELTYSIESYAAQVVADTNADANLVALVKAMMRYGDAAAAYVEGAPAHRYDENGRCVVCTTAHFTAGKNVYIETESVDLLTEAGSDPLFTEAPLVVENDAKWSGGTAIRSNVGYTETNGYDADAVPHISFTVTPEKDGTYYIWIRGNNTANDFKYFVDDDNNTQVKYELTEPGSDGTTEKWYCLPDSYTWTAGNDYMVRFRIHHTLVRFDQFVITSDANFNPGTHTHTFGTEYGYDSAGHGLKADCCYGVMSDITAHTYEHGKCVCGYELYSQVIEAEDVNLNSVQDPNNNSNIGNSVTSNANASGGKIVRLMGYNTTAPTADQFAHMSFEVTPEETGTYYIWIKAYVGQNAYLFADIEGVNDTYVQRLIGGNTYSTTYNGTQGSATSDFVWVCMPVGTNNTTQECQWTGGKTYEVRIRARDIAIWIDQFLITNDANFDPATHTHTFGADYGFNSEGHWQKADCCDGVKGEVVAHTIVNSKCFCGYELFKQVIQAEDANLMTEQDTTVSGTTNPPTMVYEITASTGKTNPDGNVVRMYVGNNVTQADDAPAHLSFDVTPDEDGKYDIWMKYYLAGTDSDYTYVWQKTEGAHTSWTKTTVKPGTGFTLGQNANYGWIKLSTAEWEAGETYTVGLRSNAIALYIDEFMVTNDASFDPAAN